MKGMIPFMINHLLHTCQAFTLACTAADCFQDLVLDSVLKYPLV